MLRHQTSIDPAPPDADLREYSFGVEFNFGAGPEDTHLSLHSSNQNLTAELLRFWMPYKFEGPAYLEGHKTDIFLAVPAPENSDVPIRLHVTARFAEMEDLETDLGVEHRQDFDRAMDIAQRMVGDLIEAGLISAPARMVEIVAEPLSPEGALRPGSMESMGFCIGATWLQYDGRSVFGSYRVWDPQSAEWKE